MHVTRLRSVLAAALAAAGCDEGDKAPIASPAARPSATAPSATAPSATAPSPAAPSELAQDASVPTDDFKCETWPEVIRASLGADYVGVRIAQGDRVFTGSTAGAPCKTARDQKSCAGKLAKDPCGPAYRHDKPAVRASKPACTIWPPRGGHAPNVSSIQVTRGDEVIVIRTAAELTQLLAPIDSPAEAYLLLDVGHLTPQCKGDWIQSTHDGFIVTTTLQVSDCPPQSATVHFAVMRDGTIEERRREVHPPGKGGCGAGRRPAGLLATSHRASSAVGHYFAAIAHLEAASVAAFERLVAELRAHRAPAFLVRAASRARNDEIRHTNMMTALAHRYGGIVKAPTVRRMPSRSLRAFAIENVREGCVRETWGALEAAHQARMSIDPEVRRVYRTIALDEARHAALSWQIASWAEQRLSAHDARHVRSARDRAVRSLARELSDACMEPTLVRLAGLPAPSTRARLLASLQSTLWVN